MPNSLEFVSVSKVYGSTKAVESVSFAVEKGQFFSILGSSGCGKTTLLRLVAGFEQPDSGKILLDGEDISKLPPNRRPVNTVFQNYALFPHLTIFENIAFGLRVQKKPESYIKKEVAKMLELIQMEEHGFKKPHQISGGQKQRVAIARALINRPRLLLLDEPLAALDLKLRQKMLLELDLIHDEVGITFLFVTHDQSEAMAVSDKIAVMHKGIVEQIGTPAELYETPKSSFVAAFIGDTNFLDGAVSDKPSKEYCRLEIDNFPDVICFNDKKLNVGDSVHLTVRPEKIHISKEKPQLGEEHNLFEAEVCDVVYKGDHTKYWVDTHGQRFAITQQHSRFLLDVTPITWRDRVWIWWHRDDAYMLERYNLKDTTLTEMPSETIGEVTEEEIE